MWCRSWPIGGALAEAGDGPRVGRAPPRRGVRAGRARGPGRGLNDLLVVESVGNPRTPVFPLPSYLFLSVHVRFPKRAGRLRGMGVVGALFQGCVLGCLARRGMPAVDAASCLGGLCIVQVCDKADSSATMGLAQDQVVKENMLAQPLTTNRPYSCMRTDNKLKPNRHPQLGADDPTGLQAASQAASPASPARPRCSTIRGMTRFL